MGNIGKHDVQIEYACVRFSLSWWNHSQVDPAAFWAFSITGIGTPEKKKEKKNPHKN